MGASNPHPHGQIWAIDALPNEPRPKTPINATTSEPTARRSCGTISSWSWATLIG
jgi:hypothetical protein